MEVTNSNPNGQLDKTKPCVEHQNGSCTCFTPQDHHKGMSIYYKEPVCYLRAIGVQMPGDIDD